MIDNYNWQRTQAAFIQQINTTSVIILTLDWTKKNREITSRYGTDDTWSIRNCYAKKLNTWCPLHQLHIQYTSLNTVNTSCELWDSEMHDGKRSLEVWSFA